MTVEWIFSTVDNNDIETTSTTLAATVANDEEVVTPTGTPVLLPDKNLFVAADNLVVPFPDSNANLLQIGNVLPPGVDPNSIRETRLVNADGDENNVRNDLLLCSETGGWILLGDGTWESYKSATPTSFSDETSPVTDALITAEGDLVVAIDGGPPKIYHADSTRPGDFRFTKHTVLGTEDLTRPKVAIASNGDLIFSSDSSTSGAWGFIKADGYATAVQIPDTVSVQTTDVAIGVSGGSMGEVLAFASRVGGEVYKNLDTLGLAGLTARDEVFAVSYATGVIFADVVPNVADGFNDIVYSSRGATTMGHVVKNVAGNSFDATLIDVGDGTGPTSDVDGRPIVGQLVGTGAPTNQIGIRTNGAQTFVWTPDAGGSYISDAPAIINLAQQALSTEIESSNGLGAVGSIRGTDDLDILSGAFITHHDASLTPLPSNGNGFPATNRHRWWNRGPLPKRAIFFDMDDDTDLDIVVLPAGQGDRIVVLLNPGDGDFRLAEAIELTGANSGETWESDRYDGILVYRDPSGSAVLVAWGATTTQRNVHGVVNPTDIASTVPTVDAGDDSDLYDVYEIIATDLRKVAVASRPPETENRGLVMATSNGLRLRRADAADTDSPSTTLLSGTDIIKVAMGDVDNTGWESIVYVTDTGIFYIPRSRVCDWCDAPVALGAGWAQGDRVPTALAVVDVDANGELLLLESSTPTHLVSLGLCTGIRPKPSPPSRRHRRRPHRPRIRRHRTRPRQLTGCLLRRNRQSKRHGRDHQDAPLASLRVRRRDGLLCRGRHFGRFPQGHHLLPQGRALSDRHRKRHWHPRRLCGPRRRHHGTAQGLPRVVQRWCGWYEHHAHRHDHHGSRSGHRRICTHLHRAGGGRRLRPPQPPALPRARGAGRRDRDDLLHRVSLGPLP